METAQMISVTQDHYNSLNLKIFSLNRDLELAQTRAREEEQRRDSVENRLDGDLDRVQQTSQAQAFTITRLLEQIQNLGAQVHHLEQSLASARNCAENWAKHRSQVDTCQEKLMP